MGNAFYPNTGKLFSKRYLPALLDCHFTVASTDSGGLGITGLVGPGITNVFMNTNQTPGTGSNGIVNPNPAAGYIAIQLADNYNKFLFMNHTLESTVGGSNIAVGGAALTAGQLYVITVVGTTTAAEWVTVGLPIGVTAAVGASFIARATGAGSGSGQVKVPAAAGSGISHIEVVGVPNQTIAPSGPATGTKGSWIFLQCLAGTGTSQALTFTGSALGTHTHSFTPAGSVAAGVIPVTAGTAGDAVTNNAGVLESTGGEDLTVNAQAFTGDAGTTGATSGGTPAGTINTPTITSSFAAAAPADGTIISIQLGMSFSSLDV